MIDPLYDIRMSMNGFTAKCDECGQRMEHKHFEHLYKLIHEHTRRHINQYETTKAKDLAFILAAVTIVTFLAIAGLTLWNS